MATLHGKIFGCLAATRIASAMGAAVECWDMARIEKTYGVLDRLLKYHHYDVDWDHPAGCTEDGIERQKLQCTAIMKKQDRITARDLVATWLEVLDPEKMRYMTEAFDRHLLAIAKTGLVPPWQLGMLSPYADLNTTGRSMHGVPLINAGDPRGAVDDMHEIARVYQPAHSTAFAWGEPYNAAVAAAFLPNATVDSVIQVGLDYARGDIRKEIEKSVELGRANRKDPLALRAPMNAWYEGRTGHYPLSRADENICKAFAVFAATEGDTRQAIVVGVNFGRDTDCTAASAAGLAGALTGQGTIPDEWIEQVEEATRNNPYTNSHLTIAETADGMHGALMARLRRAKEHAETMLGS